MRQRVLGVKLYSLTVRNLVTSYWFKKIFSFHFFFSKAALDGFSNQLFLIKLVVFKHQ